MGTTIARLALIVLLAATGFAQGSDSHSAFDAASVKLSGGDPVIPGVSHRMRGGPGTGSPGRITYTQVPLMQVLMKAWDLRDYQIAGPAWLYGVVDRTALYTIMATLPPETTKQEFQAMLQNLVVKRFRMEFHRETRSPALTWLSHRAVQYLRSPRILTPPNPLPARLQELAGTGFLSFRRAMARA